MSVFLYDNTVEIEFNEGNHRYKVNGEYKPGVTGILSVINKPLLLEWSASMAAEAYRDAVARQLAEGGKITDSWLKKTTGEAKKAHTKHSDKAKDLGHVVHAAIEQFLNGNYTPPDDPVANRLVKQFGDWFAGSGYIALGTEQIIYSKEHDYCGTFDALLNYNNNGVVLSDVKTTKRSFQNQKGIYPEYVAQLGAYAIAYEEEHGEPVTDLMIINPDKEYGEIQVVKLSTLGITVADAKDAFLQALALYKAIKPLEFRLKNQNSLKKRDWYLKQRLDDSQ